MIKKDFQMASQKMTKRQAIQIVVRELEGWLDRRGVIDTKTVQLLKIKHGVTTERTVAAIEQFVLPAFECKQLPEYVRAEMEKAHFFSYKLKGAADDPEIQSKLEAAAAALKTMTEEDVLVVCRHLVNLCRIIKK